MQEQRLHRPALGLSIAKGELFPLYLRRLRWVANHNLSPKTAWMLPSRMGPVITLLGRSVGTFEEVINNNTLIPLASRFIAPEDTERIVSHFIEGPKGGLASKVGMAGQSSGWAKHRLLRCVQCLKEDIGARGKPFWRRDHLLPGILFCGKHKMPLSLPCEPCANYARHPNRTLHAGHHCGCGLTPLKEATRLTDKQAEVEIELARITSSLLDADYLPNLDVQRVAAETRNATARLGLLRDGAIRLTEAREFLMESPWNSLLLRTGVLNLGAVKFQRFLKGDQVFRHPISAISMLTSLAGEWQDLVRTVETQSDAAVELPKLSSAAEIVNLDSSARALSPERIAKVYERYRRLRAEHPERNHSELRRSFATDTHSYMTRELLIAAGVDVPTSRRQMDRNKDARLNQSLIAHIEQRSRQLRAAEHPHRIVIQTLMSTFHRPRIFNQKRMVERLEAAYEVLHRHTETDAGWRKRMKAIDDRERAHSRSKARGATTAAATKDATDQED